jgi:hypothetical protein
VPYEKRRRKLEHGKGVLVLIGDAVVESRGRSSPRETPIRDSVSGRPIAGPGTMRDHGPSSNAKTVVRIGDAYDVQTSDSLAAAERRRYGGYTKKRR